MDPHLEVKFENWKQHPITQQLFHHLNQRQPEKFLSRIIELRGQGHILDEAIADAKSHAKLADLITNGLFIQQPQLNKPNA